MRGATLFSIVSIWLVGCGAEPAQENGEGASATAEGSVVATVHELASPAPVGSFGPELTTGPDGEVILSWLETLDPEDRQKARLRWSRLGDEGWGEPREVPVGEKLFANWADRPHIVPVGEGRLVAHWLEMVGDGTYTYGIALGHSSDGGTSWRPAGWLHDDLSPQEHGFASWIVDGEGLRAVWLDGRAMGDGGPMQLRALRLDPANPKGEGPGRTATVLDARVCECCDTDTVMTPTGPVVAYRDRGDEEVRNIGIVRHGAEGWGEPTFVHDDGWAIHGCPVNGPALAAAGEGLAVAWFTLGNDETPRVRLALSDDGGTTFGEPIEVSAGDGKPLGRVDLELDAGGTAWVLWLDERSEDRAEVRLRPIGPGGEIGQSVVVAETAASRAAGVPRLARRGDTLIVAWVETGTDKDAPRQVRTARLSVGRV